MLIKVLFEFHRRIVVFFCLRVDGPKNGGGGRGRGRGPGGGSYNRKFTVYYDYS